MDKLVLEKSVAVETEKQEEIKTKIENTQKLPEAEKAGTPIQTEYLRSLDNMTIGDFKKQEENEKVKKFEVEREELIQQQYQVEEEKFPKQESQNVIEKPNYDFIPENKKIIKFHKKEKTQNLQKKSPKKRGIVFAVALAICSVLAVTNITLLESYSANLSNIEQEFYEVNLPKYLKNIANLDTTRKSMEFVETYPQEMQNAGDLGEKTNWYDKLTNFISGVFGG